MTASAERGRRIPQGKPQGFPAGAIGEMPYMMLRDALSKPAKPGEEMVPRSHLDATIAFGNHYIDLWNDLRDKAFKYRDGFEKAAGGMKDAALGAFWEREKIHADREAALEVLGQTELDARLRVAMVTLHIAERVWPYLNQDKSLYDMLEESRQIRNKVNELNGWPQESYREERDQRRAWKARVTPQLTTP